MHRKARLQRSRLLLARLAPSDSDGLPTVLSKLFICSLDSFPPYNTGSHVVLFFPLFGLFGLGDFGLFFFWESFLRFSSLVCSSRSLTDCASVTGSEMFSSAIFTDFFASFLGLVSFLSDTIIDLILF